MHIGGYLSSLSLIAIVAAGTIPAYAQDAATQKDATEATRAANDALLTQLPFDDTSDFDDAKRGLIAPLPTEMIQGQGGNAIWNPQQYSFITEGAEAPATVNPSLWRQSQLINISGLFEVTEGLYQVRNFDLSNMTIIEGTEGITIVDSARLVRNGKGRSRLVPKTSGQQACKGGHLHAQPRRSLWRRTRHRG
ncbi:hypothetical protein [Sinorhizobium meliloti]|uniref:hypothetical protein n=1 Tax=Rhizobium meliloti TaxID=382 RepID=UPI001F1A47B7|nr:hypothetical protein [Sinorhizobium meliloti]